MSKIRTIRTCELPLRGLFIILSINKSIRSFNYITKQLYLVIIDSNGYKI